MSAMPEPARRLLHGVALVLSAVTAASSLAREPAEPASAPPAPSAAGFLDAHGDGWRVVHEPIAGHPAFVYGSRFAPPVAPRTDAGFVESARRVLDRHPDLFGVTGADLADRAVKHLELSRIGSSDKVAVQLDQRAGDLPVFRGTVTVLFDRASGDVLALDSTAVPFAGRASARAVGSTAAAVASAEAAYAERFGVAAARVDDVEVAVVGPSAFFGRRSPLSRRGATLAYLVTLSTPGARGSHGLPAVGRVFVSAEGDAEVLHVEPLAKGVDGKVTAQVNVDQDVPTPTNQETVALPNLYVTDGTAFGSILALTDGAGAYSTAGPGPTNLFFRLSGPFCRVDNDDPSDTDTSFLLSGATGSNNDVLFNPAAAEFTTAEAAAFHWVNRFRQWVRDSDPNDFTMEFPVLAEVNRANAICDSFYDASEPSIVFGRAGSGCANTAYGDVVLHENGHLAVEIYNGPVSGAFGEGTADALAYTIHDDPCLESYQSGGGCLRTALQTAVLKCPGDGNEECHGGDPHVEGQALASAIWAVRDRLNQTHGDAAGDAIADALLSGWLNTFFDAALLNVIVDHWLVLDDDNGSLLDGTPNFADVNGGFTQYGWAGYPTIDFTLQTAPPDQFEVGHLSPVLVVATVESLGTPLTGVRLYRSVSGGAYQSIAMAPTGQPDTYAVQIPGVPSPAKVRWFLEASNAFETRTAPPGGSAAPLSYVCGTTTTVRFYPFEEPTDEGWTHVSLGGQFGDQWERGSPAGSNESTDPNQAYSAPNVWGTDLSLSGFDGKYEPNGSGELRTPTLPLQSLSNVHLRFRRHLAVQDAANDQAEILVNGTTVWTNPTGVDAFDEDWVPVDLDISAQAAGLPTTVAWRLTSDGSVEYGGWNLDDVRLYTLSASAPGFIQAYGAGCPGSGGLVPSLAGAGTPISEGSVTLTVANGLPNGAGALLVGLTQEAAALGFGCTLLVGAVLPAALPVTLDGAGGLSLPAAIPPNAPALDLFLQYFGGDAGGPNGTYSSSNGLQLHF